MVSAEILKEIILENRVEVMRHKVVPRNISLDGFDRQVLVGVRRSGKSYLLYEKIQRLILEDGYSWDEILYLNFEDERLADMKVEDLNKILEVFGSISSHRPMLFLDEIQTIEGWSRFARRLADNKYTLYITGSNAKMLSRDIESELGARFITQEVYPFSYSEFLRAKGVDILLPDFLATTYSRSEESKYREEYYRFGGFPEVVDVVVKRDYLTSLYQKIFLGDIAARHGIENIFALRILFKKLAESVRHPLSFNRATNIIRSTGTKVSKDTVIRYLDYAREACLIYPFYNFASTIVDKESTPKYYFIDNGIISLFHSEVNTGLLENAVAVELLRRYGANGKVYYYGAYSVEVDFYLPDENIAIQACYDYTSTAETAERETRALVKISKRFATRRNIIVTYDCDEKIRVNNVDIEIISLSRFMLNPIN